MPPPAPTAGEAVCSPVQLDLAMPAPVTRIGGPLVMALMAPPPHTAAAGPAAYPPSFLTGELVSRPPPRPPAVGHRPQHCPFESYTGQPWSNPPLSPAAGGPLPPPPLYSVGDDISELEQQEEVRHHPIGPDPDPTSPKC